MENHKPLLLSSLTLLLIIPIAAAAISEPELELELELESATSALRSAGYNLFPNAIATTDLRYLILSSSSTSTTTASPNTTTKFTLFAPPDSYLFSLDFSSQADRYFLSLLRHVSPLRLTSADLLDIAGRPDGLRSVPSLLPSHGLGIRMTSPSFLPNGNPSSSLAVNGVNIVAPDLYVGSSMAVQGLDRIILGDDPIPGSSLGSTDGISEYRLNQNGDRSFGSIQMLVDKDENGEKKLGYEATKEGHNNNGHDRFFKFGSRFSG